MDIYVQDSDFYSVNLIENYESLIWTERYSKFGDFDLKIGPGQVHREVVEQAKYLAIGGSDRTMVVETVNNTPEGIRITGRSMESILDRRVIHTDGPTTASNLISFLSNILMYNIGGSASPSSRQISNLYIYGTSPDGFPNPSKYEAVKPGENLYEAMERLCTAHNLGFKIVVPKNSTNMEFYFYYGNAPEYLGAYTNVVFSESIGNIHNSSQLKSSSTYKNLAVVNLPPQDNSVGLGDIWWINPGSGDGSQTGAIPSGLDRRELWTDASDLRRDDTFTETNKASRAISWGKQTLTEHPKINDVDFEITKSNTYEYGVDYNLGDVVTVVSLDGGEVQHRVTEYIRSVGPEGHAEFPTLKAL